MSQDWSESRQAEEAIDQQTAHLRFDIPLLAERLVAATGGWVTSPRLDPFRWVISAPVPAVVRRWLQRRLCRKELARWSPEGRPDLARDALPQVRAPTLLIVGGRDLTVLELNRAAMARMRTEVRLEIVPAATHLFEEPGALVTVAHLARDWSLQHLRA